MRHKKTRKYRTRPDPFAEVWEQIESRLEADPDLGAKTIMEWLQKKYLGQFYAGQLRTLQRRIRRWRVREATECSNWNAHPEPSAREAK